MPQTIFQPVPQTDVQRQRAYRARLVHFLPDGPAKVMARLKIIFKSKTYPANYVARLSRVLDNWEQEPKDTRK